MTKTRRPAGLCILGTLLTLAPFVSVLRDSGAALLYRDLSNIMIPYKATWLAAVRELHHIPHWDPLHAGGSRFLADLNYGPLYPLNPLLFLFGNVARGLTLWIVFHHVLIFLGQFALLRDLRIRPALCLLGGLALAWCGPSLSADCLLHHLCGQAAVGWFFLFWRRALRRETLGPELFAASLALAWPVYGGDPQYTFFLALGGAGLAILSRGRRPLAKTGALGVLALLAAAPQLFPTLSDLAVSGRLLDAQTDADRLAWSLHPLRLFELAFPLPFGDDPSAYRAAFLLGGPGEPFVFSQYAGTFAALFSLVHLGLWRPRRARAWLPIAWLLAVTALTLGSFTPLYALFLKLVPLWRSFRYPERIGYWIVLSLQVFALVGLEKLLRLRSSRLRVFAPAGVLLAAALGFGAWLAARGFAITPVARTLLFALALLGSLRAPRRYRAYALAAVALLDLGPVAARLVWPAPVSLTRLDSYPWAAKIAAERARSGDSGRFFSLLTKSLEPPAPGTGVYASVYSAWAGMKFNTPSYWGIPLARGHSSLTPDRPALRLAPESRELARRTLDLFSTRYLLGLENGMPAALVNNEALPPAFAPAAVETFPDEAAMFARLRSPAWSQWASALIESDSAPAADPAPLRVDSLAQRWEKITVILAPGGGTRARWLVVNEAYDPLWRARLGGEDLPVARANGWALGILLPPIPAGGTVKLELRYWDVWYECGLLAFCLWLALLFTAGLPRRRAR